MNVQEFILKTKANTINIYSCMELYSKYLGEWPDFVLRLISNCQDTLFLDDGKRVLSFTEILNAETELHVDFSDKGLLPLVDCGDNDFIVYSFKEKNWALFNIVDEVLFHKADSIESLI